MTQEPILDLPIITRLQQIVAKATPLPWCWWTSNSYYRLSSTPTGKDGDVLHAFRAKDGLCCVAVKEDDAKLIEAAVNHLPMLLSMAKDAADTRKEAIDLRVALTVLLDACTGSIQFDIDKEMIADAVALARQALNGA